MNNEQFQWTKREVNLVLARQRLHGLGMSAPGVEQVLAGQPVTNPSDVTLLGRITLHAVAGFGMTFWPRVGAEVIVVPPEH